MKTLRTLKKVQIKTPHYQPQIDLSEFREDDGNEFRALRFCYYTNSGKFPNRPLLITEEFLVELLVKAFQEKLFSDDSREKILTALKEIKPTVKSPGDLYGRYTGDVTERDFEALKRGLDGKDF